MTPENVDSATLELLGRMTAWARIRVRWPWRVARRKRDVLLRASSAFVGGRKVGGLA
jgi:hypothetical protein